MQTTLSTLPLAGHTLHQVEFDPASFHEHDLLWLPHYAHLSSAGRKRKAEHLAGRIAAVHALREYGDKTVPGIGEQRQPLWPDEVFGSISHSATTALAVVSRHPIGVDTEEIFAPQLAGELADSIVTASEREWLVKSRLPYEQTLTLAFSAKESAFKATGLSQQANAGFLQYQIFDLQENQMLLRQYDQTYCVQWRFSASHVVTLASVYA